jgi:hypothetical protein
MPLKKQVLNPAGFNQNALLPFSLRLKDFELAMQDVYDFFYDVNKLLLDKGLHRMDDMLRPAAMSGMLSDMLTASMAKHSRVLAENKYFNGHPDLVVQGRYANNSVASGTDGIEIKSTRKKGGAVDTHGGRDQWMALSGRRIRMAGFGAAVVYPRLRHRSALRPSRIHRSRAAEAASRQGWRLADPAFVRWPPARAAATLELGEIARDHAHIEAAQDRLLRLAVEQEAERCLDQTLGRVHAGDESFIQLARKRDVMQRRALALAHDDVEFERVIVGDAPDLDHGPS